jgi:DNA (cytosine-5)-methyltransferase 1
MNAISLFSGCGGDTLGMEMGGIEVVAFAENDKNAIISHKLNFPTCKLIGNGDVTKITNEEYMEYKNRVDIIFAGFPCQGFSNAGKKNPEDPRNILFLEFLRATSVINPTWILGENVKGMLSRVTSDGTLVIDYIKQEFKKIGYSISFKLFKMTQFGVPQNRERVIIIGKREDDFVFNFQEIPVQETSLRDILEDDMVGSVCIKSIGLDIPKDKCVNTDKIQQGTPHKYLSQQVTKKLLSFGKRVSPFHCEIIDIDKPCKTIISSYARCPRLYVPLINNVGDIYVRCLNINEIKQIMGFPKDFKLSDKNQIIQLGNAIPPLFIKYIVSLLV